MPDPTLIFVIVIIGIALAFDFVNGFHDAANSIATVVSTRVLTPLQGVVWAAIFNFIAAFTFGTAVAKTIGSGLIDVNKVDNYVILAGLIGAVTWDLITWRLGLPTSSSHALIGGYAGAAVVKAGFGVIILQGWVKTLAFIIIAPVLGWLMATIFITIIFWIFRKQTPGSVDHIFRRGQLVSAGLYSLGHGTNDAQKTMGIIAGVLFTVPAYRHLVTDPTGSLFIPFWIVLMAHAAIALGTLSGGWRIVHTVGSKITKLVPMGGFAAETAGAVTIFASSILGIPVSTTHVITGAIVGVGSVRNVRSVRWGVAGQIVWAWLLTIPMSALIAVLVYGLILLVQRIFLTFHWYFCCMNKPFLARFPLTIHPLLFSLYPVVALFTSNAAQMDPAGAVRPLLLSVAFAVVLFTLLWLLLRNQPKAALLTSLAVILFFTYGHVYLLIKPAPVLGAILGRQSVLFILWLGLLGVGGFFIIRSKKNLEVANRFLNVMAAAALVIPLASYALFLVRTSGQTSAVEKIAPVQYPLQRIPGKPLPDIYYIILDMYARDDVLNTEFQLDTQPFLNELEQMGFTVAPCSQSNYTQTELSLSSSLNMNYLEAFDSRYQSGYMDRTGLPPLIKSSAVRRSLAGLGYKTVDFQTEYPFINLTDADYYLSMSTNGLGYLQNSLGANAFETMLLKTTAGLVLTSFSSPDENYIKSLLDSPSKEHIARELFLLGTLPDVPRYPSPKFVYAHILIPHGPMVFGPEGPLDPKYFLPVDENNNMRTDDFIAAYRNQVEFIDNRLIPILRTILQRSKTPPIIIVQGDHGPWTRPEILNAYYLPDNGSQGLYPAISPVNSFRYIFNTYFGASYPLLPDHSYSTNDYDPFAHNLYPNTGGCAN